MSKNKQILNVVNDQDEIIGTDSRENIHQKGLLHREISVWFFTPKGEIIFQHRSKNKDTYPDVLDVTVGGHVEIGDSYEETALKEALEETGLKLKKEDLIYIDKIRKESHDKGTGMINNAIKSVFAYKFLGNISDLKTEEGESLGFEVYKIDDLLNNTDEAFQAKFIPGIFKPQTFEIFDKIKLLILCQTQ